MKKTNHTNLNFILISLTLIFVLELALLWYQWNFYTSKLVEIILNVYGAFVATVIGVYVSIYYTNKQNKEVESSTHQKVMLGSLKLIWIDLELTIMALNNILGGLKTMPTDLAYLHDRFIFLLSYAKYIRCNAYWGAIASGAINDICLHDDIFNDTQIAVNNIELTVHGLEMTTGVFEDYTDTSKRPRKAEEISKFIISKEIKKVENTLAFATKARNSIALYLEKEGIEFKFDSLPEQESIPEELLKE